LRNIGQQRERHREKNQETEMDQDRTSKKE
jgi:hypothetical protein